MHIIPAEVLLIENNPDAVERILNAFELKNLGNKIFYVNNGKKAKEYLFGKEDLQIQIKEKLKLILLEIKLPDIDGLEILRIIKTDDRIKAIPVVILTSSNENSDIAESYKLGANSYIVKPTELEKFNSTISEIGYYWLVINELL
jgi:two-component system, response regulator